MTLGCAAAVGATNMGELILLMCGYVWQIGILFVFERQMADGFAFSFWMRPLGL